MNGRLGQLAVALVGSVLVCVSPLLESRGAASEQLSEAHGEILAELESRWWGWPRRRARFSRTKGLRSLDRQLAVLGGRAGQRAPRAEPDCPGNVHRRDVASRIGREIPTRLPNRPLGRRPPIGQSDHLPWYAQQQPAGGGTVWACEHRPRRSGRNGELRDRFPFGTVSPAQMDPGRRGRRDRMHPRRLLADAVDRDGKRGDRSGAPLRSRLPHRAGSVAPRRRRSVGDEAASSHPVQTPRAERDGRRDPRRRAAAAVPRPPGS